MSAIRVPLFLAAAALPYRGVAADPPPPRAVERTVRPMVIDVRADRTAVAPNVPEFTSGPVKYTADPGVSQESALKAAANKAESAVKTKTRNWMDEFTSQVRPIVDAYDTETNHGNDPQKQREWDTDYKSKIKKELERLGYDK